MMKKDEMADNSNFLSYIYFGGMNPGIVLLLKATVIPNINLEKSVYDLSWTWKCLQYTSGLLSILLNVLLF